TSASLAWDPPTGAAWEDATHTARGMRSRADQLFQAITTAQLDADLWREQRDLADASHDLLDVSDAVADYRAAVDMLPLGDASSTLRLLDGAWSRWESTAARFGMSRGELVNCATTG